MINRKSISVIIHTYHRYDSLKTVLDRLSLQTIRPHEIIISDQTPQEIRPQGFYEGYKDLPLKIINIDRPLHAPAQNIGVSRSSGNLLVFLDDDCDFKEDFLEQHVSVMEDEKVDAVVGPNSTIEDINRKLGRDSLIFRDPISIFIKKVPPAWNGMVIYTTGGNTSIKREFFLRTGGYDEKIPRMADVELGFRFYKMGAKIFHSSRPFVHHLKSKMGGTRTAQKNIPLLRLVSYLYIYNKHLPGWSTTQFCLREISNYIFFREPINGRFNLSNLLNPFRPFMNIYNLFLACIRVKKLLKKVK